MKKVLFAIGLLCTFSVSSYAQQKQDWLAPTLFSAMNFNNPPLQYAPMTRWWWPGNDVTQDELKREVNLFADNHFGGIEIQPLALVSPQKSKEQTSRIMSFDTPVYYANVKAVLEEAQKRGLIVDMTVGSGWPSGGEHISEAENNLTLKSAVTDIPLGNTSPIALPKIARGHRPSAKLVTLLAAKILKEENGTMTVDQSTVTDITSNVRDDGTFLYSPASDGYKAIAIWSMASMEKPMIMAKRNSGLVANHFDGKVIAKNYDYYFGEHTGYESFYGHPLRALFNDSYEFKVDRHFSENFINTFQTSRGYSPILTLPANIWPGYDNLYDRLAKPNVQPSFTFGKEDWRIRYDYDLTLSDILRKEFLDTSSAWATQRGMLHRSQGYGINMDIMGVAGSLDIPEGETMIFNYGTEAGYKLVTSGAHLYNKPIITSESAVYNGRALMTTPQKLKMVIDKILSAGINQIIWHGTPYYYKADGQPKEGWRPYYNGLAGINFSSEIYEGNEFWNNISEVNHYAQRAQYVLRSGKPQADILIYYPFLNYSEETYNPKELLPKGYIPGVEPFMDISSKPNAYTNLVSKDWLDSIYPLIDHLNAQGITWDWINDESLQAMSMENDRQLNVRGNLYQGIVLYNLPYIQLASAQHLHSLVSQGVKVLTIGEPAKKQPSYKDYKQNDALTETLMQAITIMPSATTVKGIDDAADWFSKLNIPLRSISSKDIVRQIRRQLDNYSLVQFYYNESNEWTSLQVQLDKPYKYAYWMDAEDGSIRQTNIKKGIVACDLRPLGTTFLYVSQQPMTVKTDKNPAFSPAKAKVLYENDTWDLEVAGNKYFAMKAQNWREVDALKYKDAPGHYHMTMNIDKINKKAHYYLDLGEVYYTASLKVNGKEVGERIWAPYLFDITSYLQQGENVVDVTVMPSRYNSLVKRAIDGENDYRSLKESALASEGMVGKYILYEQK